MYDSWYVVRRRHRLDSVDELQQRQWMLGDAVVRPSCKLKLTNFAFVEVVTLDALNIASHYCTILSAGYK